MKTTLKSFYWVASAYDAPGESAWHLEVVDEAETLDEAKAMGKPARERTLAIAQAVELGFDLPKIADGINVHLMAEVEALRAERQAWRDRHVALAEDVAAERARGELRSRSLELQHRELTELRAANPIDDLQS